MLKLIWCVVSHPKGTRHNLYEKNRPISLLNCSSKISTEVLTNWIAALMNILTYSNQTSFIKGRYILESVVTAHDMLYSVHPNKNLGLFL
jgi:hypothetical protein